MALRVRQTRSVETGVSRGAERQAMRGDLRDGCSPCSEVAAQVARVCNS